MAEYDWKFEQPEDIKIAYYGRGIRYTEGAMALDVALDLKAERRRRAAWARAHPWRARAQRLVWRWRALWGRVALACRVLWTGDCGHDDW